MSTIHNQRSLEKSSHKSLLWRNKPKRRAVDVFDIGSTRIPDFLLSAALIYDSIVPGTSFSYQLITLSCLAALSLTRKPLATFKAQPAIPWILFFALLYVATISVLTDHSALAFSWQTRLVRIGLIVLVSFTIATGQMHFPSVIKGLAAGLLANAAAFYAGITPDTYGGVLTGWIGDKNKAALFYAIATMLALLLCRRLQSSAIVLVIGATLVWLTGSRTTIAALILGVLWIVIAAGRAAWIRVALAGVFYQFLGYLEDNFARAGDFASRTGSDLLRGRIDEATDLKVAAASFFGEGLGEAYVQLQGRLWLFHNSYKTLLIEGGWPYLVLIVGVTILVTLHPFSPGAVLYEHKVIQGVAVALFVTATRLGEVFLTTAWAIVFGIALHYALTLPVKDTSGTELLAKYGIKDE